MIGQMKLRILSELGALRTSLIALLDVLTLDAKELQYYAEINQNLANELEAYNNCQSLAETKRSL
jgi:hypothetical protein